MTTVAKTFKNIGSACIFLAVFGLLFLASSPKNLIFTKKNKVVRKTTTKRNAPDVFQKITDRCEVPKLQVPQEKVFPSFLASYPGSGTRLQWELVEAITGIVTTDDGFSNGHHNVIALKTHYPCPAGRLFPGAEDILKAIIFIRHPMEALPAYHDIIYASENNLSVDPSPRAPLEEWVTWRDMSFARELETWRKHFTYWIDRFGSLNRVIVPLEHLTSRKYGPGLVIRIADFLRQGNNDIETVDATDIPCIWQKILKKVESNGTKGKEKVRRRLQQQDMLNLSQQQQPINQVVEMHQSNTGTSGGVATQQISASPISSKTQIHTSSGGQNMEQPISFANFGKSRHLGTDSNQIDQANDEMKPAEEQKGVIDKQVDANPPGGELRPIGDDSGGVDVQIHAQPASDEMGPTEEQNGGDHLQVDAVSNQANYGTAKEAPTSTQQDEDKQRTNGGTNGVAPLEVDTPSLEVDKSDQKVNQVVPTVKGYDAYRPYTENQRKEVVIVLTQLLEIYRDDSVLAPLLVDYIDQITNDLTEEK